MQHSTSFKLAAKSENTCVRLLRVWGYFSLCLDKMNGLIKRTSGKGLSVMANENGKSSSSKSRMYEVNSSSDQENGTSNIPIIKLADNVQLLPKYTAGTALLLVLVSP